MFRFHGAAAPCMPPKGGKSLAGQAHAWGFSEYLDDSALNKGILPMTHLMVLEQGNIK